jgi:hypothetical protein
VCSTHTEPRVGPKYIASIRKIETNISPVGLKHWLQDTTEVGLTEIGLRMYAGFCEDCKEVSR